MLAIALAWSGVSLAALVVVLARLSIDPTGTSAAAAANLHALWPLWISSASAWAGLTGVWLALRRVGPPDSRLAAVLIVLGVAVAARVAVVVTHVPQLSDDIYRYAFDGRNLAHGVNPYLVRPEDRVDASPRWPGEPELAGRINNPELYTIYLPASQWVFAATAWVTPSVASPDANGRVFRGTFIAFDALAIGLLLTAVLRAGRSAWWATLYAWHPLPLAEIAGSGHQESIGIALLLGAIVLAERSRVWRWTAVLAVSSLVKPVVLPVAAFILKGRRLRSWGLSVVAGAAVCAVVAGPLLFTHDGEPLRNLLETVQRFRLKWAHFGSVYEPLLTAIEVIRPAWNNDQQEILARGICVALLAVIILTVWARRRPWDPAPVWSTARIIFLAMVLLSPAAHPWYLLWALALVPMAPGSAVWMASLTLPWGYAAWGHVAPDGTAEWGVSPWLMAAAYGPVYAALLLEGVGHKASAIRYEASGGAS